MSALLAIEALELNLNAEYGYTTREFSKIPNVYVSDNYKSCLILSYHQTHSIENRIKEYRNHFTLFRNENSILIARSETTFIHSDNDAIITYDLIIPSEHKHERYRSKFKNWDVSFDKISYSATQPKNFIGYTLIGSGEWWFYDNGVILNGLSGYKHNTKCQSILIYYELHVDHKITLPSNDSLVLMPPVIEVVLRFGNKKDQEKQTSTLPETSESTTSTSNNLFQTSNQLPNIKPIPSFNLSSVSDSLIPSINAASRPIIRQNDVVIKKDVVNKSVIPSLFWFNARCLELCSGNIDYFIPKNFICASELKNRFSQRK